MGAVRIISIVLRVIELFWAIICIGTAGWLVHNGNAHSSLNFMLFTGITAMIITLFYLLVSCVDALKQTCLGFVEAIINFAWMVFFLAASAAIADTGAIKICRSNWKDADYKKPCQTLAACIGFGFMSWLLWIVSTVLSILEMLAGNGLQVFGIGRSNAAPAYVEGSAPVQNIQL